MVDIKLRLLVRQLWSGEQAAWLLLCLTFWLLLTSGLRPLMLPDEGRYAGIAWEMLSAGDWLVPRLSGLPFFHKPPLFYWLTALSLGIFGAQAWAARMASIMGALLAVAGLYFFLRRYRSPRLAILVCVILVTQPIFFAGAQFANLDMLVAGLISVTILSAADSVARLRNRQSYQWVLLRTYALAACGVLAKGLIGLVLPGGVIVLWLLWRKEWRLIRPLLSLPGAIVFLAIAAPWFVLMQQQYPGFYDYFVVYHHFRRFAETGFNNQLPGWIYLPVILVCALPWSPWVFRWFPSVINRQWPPEQAQDGVRSLMLIWLLLIVAFFSLPSSKLVGYILPAIPPFAFLIGESFFIWWQKNASGARRVYLVTLMLAVLSCLALIVGVAMSNRTSAKALALDSADVSQTQDRLLLLDGYPYDLPFYLHLRYPPWVLGNWDDPHIDKHDNWRKELADAGKFEALARAEHLLDTARLADRVCQARDGALWVWGQKEDRTLTSWLPEKSVFRTAGKFTLWRLVAADIRTLSLCAGRPTSG
ncbi:MAG TPA: glycosyltransferase family 39 protein [Accumulibacter sp.]|nr:glycosyltransferase family 39 protein [Accumulibacter sp.]HPP47737.1 glycosyltransferase family 39 protein [Accumulibacter sp.]